MIHFKNVSFSYEKGSPVLASLNLEITPGLTLLLGPNGSGKSTLLKLASGVEKPDSGQVSVEGHDLWKDEVLARRELAYLPEHPDLTPYATIKEILHLVCRLRAEPYTSAETALKFFSLQNQANRTVRELSLGQRRRAVFAACLIGRPQCVLLDEPLEGMDRAIRDKIQNWITHRTQDGAVVVVVSHFFEKFKELASRAVTIDKGKAVVLEDLPEQPEKRLAALERFSKGGASR